MRRLTVTALALAIAGPALSQELIVTRPGAPPPAPAPTVEAAPAPSDAPGNDYEFVGWCAGVLTGHMQLFVRVKPELDAISRRWGTLESDEKTYVIQREAGGKALDLFERAMRAAEAASPRPIGESGKAAIAQGLAVWKPVDSYSPREQAYSWMNWGLSERCEAVASELEARSMLAAAPAARQAE